MSTRAHITITDSFGESLHFYRHSDGMPESTLPVLETFLDHVKAGRIRDNAAQASGWLIIFGHREFLADSKEIRKHWPGGGTRRDPALTAYGWKCGTIEPTTPELAFDIEYHYTIDLAAKSITVIAK
jgi:hypothetical protein